MSSPKMPKGFLAAKKPWETSKIKHSVKKSQAVVPNKNAFEIEYLKNKYDWSDGMYYENLLAKKTNQDQKMIDTIFQAKKRLAEMDQRRHRIQRLKRPPIISVFEKKAKQPAAASPKRKAAKAVPKPAGATCPAIKMDKKVCGAKLKDGKKYCGRHLPKTAK